MVSGELMRNILFSLTGLSLGASLIAIAIHASLLKRNFKRHAFFIAAKLGYFGVAGLVLKAILIPVTSIPPTTDTWLYALSLLLAAVGFFGVALDARSWREER